jgi:hypothetical protein
LADRRTPAERKLAAAIAAHARWAVATNREMATAPARAALEAKFEREVDPDGILSPAERSKRVANARALYYSRLALASAKARREASARGPPRREPPPAVGTGGGEMRVLVLVTDSAAIPKRRSLW